ncbi:hypothetical protein GCM10025789_01150 [Tessaracoccus lubricantis]|uniref:N-acetyltransferase domain-containing protein n=1 Tax=Tessaracoccus lubricantis TaxID=545543 RepID=A0ABP9F2X1_9ACTN
MPWLEIFGWAGSILVVWSLTLGRVLRFRWMNLTGSLVAAIYNGVIEVWPFMAMNAVIVVINIYWLTRLYRERHDEAVYEVVPVRAGDGYLKRVLAVHADDIAATHPGFRAELLDDGNRHAWLVVRGDETVGVTVVRDAGDGEGVVELDWVSPRFRDFTPGEFVHRRSGIFEDLGLRRVVVERPAKHLQEYLTRVGFVPDGDRWVRAV